MKVISCSRFKTNAITFRIKILLAGIQKVEILKPAAYNNNSETSVYIIKI